MARILTFIPWAIYTPHLETDLEIMQTCIAQNDKIDLIECNANLLSCDRNPAHDMYKCIYCVSKRMQGQGLLSQRVRTLPLYHLKRDNLDEIQSIQTGFGSIDELKSLRVESFDIGYAVLSSIVSYVRNPNILNGRANKWVAPLLQSSLAVYRSVQNYLDEGDYHRAYVFNGRFAITRAFIRACESRRIDFYTHDRGHDHDHYAVFRNATPHDLKYQNREIVTYWKNAENDAARNDKGANFYIKRSRGLDDKWFSFVAHQTEGQLPRKWDATKENIVIFISSEDEFVAIGDNWRNPLYQNQLDGIIRICKSLAGAQNVNLWLRVHPNLRNIVNEQTNGINQLDRKNLGVVAAESKVCTYALLKNASKVITFGSTVGIEAVYWGIPSILAGISMYRDLGGTYNPTDHNVLVQYARANLAPKAIKPALMYGYYMGNYGIPYRYYKAGGVFAGRFKGHRIRPTVVSLGLAALLKLLPPVNVISTNHSRERIWSDLKPRP